MKNRLLALILVGIICSCSKRTDEKQKKDVLLEGIDNTISPKDDFFAYANGQWIKNHPIPPSETTWDIGREVEEEIYKQLKEICEKSSRSNAIKGSAEQKIGDFYSTAMDTIKIERQGLQPIQPYLNRILAIKTSEEVISEMFHLASFGINAPVDFYVGQDDMNSETIVTYLWQGGLGLPDRDYYFNNDRRTKDIREAYKKHIFKMFRLLNYDSAAAFKSSMRVFKLETELARSSRKLEDLRDPYKNYNKFSMRGIDNITPDINWQLHLSKINFPPIDSVVVGQPEFLKEVNNLLKTEGVESWKDYFVLQFINKTSSKLNRSLDVEHFNFYGTVLYGTQQQRPRWKRVLDVQEDVMGSLLGQKFVKNYFSQDAKRRYEHITDNVISAYQRRIEKLDWMSDTTKQKAIVKLKAIKKKIGFPDKWRDLSTLEVGQDSYVENYLIAQRWWFNYSLNKIGKPVDRELWEITPQTYNAYYSQTNNEIVLPAAIFKIPKYTDEEVDDATIYGYVGASTIGHELTHGFDDAGSQYDERGNLKKWWTSQDERTFYNKVNKIISQFNEFVILDSLHINGKATAGENIADLGGILIALDAFKQTEQYKKGEKISGLTPLQRFFLGYALGWQGHQRDERLATLVLTDYHSPNFLRVNGPMVNISEFYDAFDVKEGDVMWKPDSLRVKIW